MTEIFFSYVSVDRERVRPVHDRLAAQGFDVFWDQEVPAGRDWDSWIREKLAQSKCLVVFWSRDSVRSGNVRHEATIANEQGKLVPVLLEPLTAEQFPIGLYTVEAANLADWKGDAGDPEWKKLSREVEDKLTPAWIRRRITEFDAELEGGRARLRSAESAIKALRAQIARDAQVHQDVKQQRDESVEEVGALKTAAEDLRQQRDKATEELTALRPVAENLKHQRDGLVDEVTALKVTVEELRRKKSEIEAHAVELSQRLTKAEARLGDANEEASNAEAQRRTLEEQCADATRRATEAESKLKALERDTNVPLVQPSKPGAIQQAPPAQPPRRTPSKWSIIFLALTGSIVVLSTFLAIANMSSSFDADTVSVFLLMAAVALALLVVPLYFVALSQFSNVMESAGGRSILFHALGSLIIWLWMSMTQTVASDYHQIFSDKIANVSLSKGTDVGTFFFVLVVVGIALLAHKSWRWRWLRYVGYGLALVWYATISIIAVSYIDRSSSWLNGLFASDYWVTTCVDVYGGTLLLLLSAAVILSRIVAYAGRHAVAWRGPQAS